MMILIMFDLPRETIEERKAANQFQKRLVRLGFEMKQYSVYEREIRTSKNIENLINIICSQLPKEGSITLYQLPNEVSNNQIRILGSGAVKILSTGPKIIVL